jgi:hypothetical protein
LPEARERGEEFDEADLGCQRRLWYDVQSSYGILNIERGGRVGPGERNERLGAELGLDRSLMLRFGGYRKAAGGPDHRRTMRRLTEIDEQVGARICGTLPRSARYRGNSLTIALLRLRLRHISPPQDIT